MIVTELSLQKKEIHCKRHMGQLMRDIVVLCLLIQYEANDIKGAENHDKQIDKVIAVIMLSAMFVSSIPMQTVYGMETDENGKSMTGVQQGELQIGNSTLNVDEGELDTDLEEGESMTEESMSEIADSESSGDENSQVQPAGEENEPPQINTDSLPQETESICLGDVNYVYIENPF